MTFTFKFKGFAPDKTVREQAQEVLIHVEDFAPASSSLSSIMTFMGSEYFCVIEIYSRKGMIRISSSHEDPVEALQMLERSAIEKLGRIKETKFFSRNTYLTKTESEPFKTLDLIQ